MTLVSRYPNKVRAAAVADVDRRRLRNPRDRTIFREVAEKFAVGEQSLRLWVKKKDDERRATSHEKSEREGRKALSSSSASQAQLEAELNRMRKQVERLKAENDVLKRAFVVFSAEWGEKD